MDLVACGGWWRWRGGAGGDGAVELVEAWGGADDAPPRRPSRGGGRSRRRRGEGEICVPGPIAMEMRLGILIPSQICSFALLPSFFSSLASSRSLSSLVLALHFFNSSYSSPPSLLLALGLVSSFFVDRIFKIIVPYRTFLQNKQMTSK